MMHCIGMNKNGIQCKLNSVNGTEYCDIHQPKFCKYCGSELRKNQYKCEECGGNDQSQIEIETPKEYIIKSIQSNQTNIEIKCDLCGCWVDEKEIIDNLCKKCSFINSTPDYVNNIIQEERKFDSNFQKIICKQCHHETNEYANHHNGSCYKCDHLNKDLFCIKCGIKIISDKYDHLCDVCYEQKFSDPIRYKYLLYCFIGGILIFFSLIVILK